MSRPEDPPVSVKAALRSGDRWVLLRNDRGEWELPGGRIDAVDATLSDVLQRECREELGVEIDVYELLGAYLFEVVPGRRVTIVGFAASMQDETAFVISDEHDAVGRFTLEELDGLRLPSGYCELIAAAAQRAHEPS